MISPKSDAFPVDAMVIKSMTFVYVLVEGFPESDPMNTPRICVSADAILPLLVVRSPNTTALPSDAIVTNSSKLGAR